MIIHVIKECSCCSHVASLSGRTPLPQIITALRTVLFISHPDGMMNSDPPSSTSGDFQLFMAMLYEYGLR